MSSEEIEDQEIRHRPPHSKEAESRFLLGEAENEDDPFVQQSGGKRGRAAGRGGGGGTKSEGTGEAVRGEGGQGGDYWDLDDDGDWGSPDKEDTPEQR